MRLISVVLITLVLLVPALSVTAQSRSAEVCVTADDPRLTLKRGDALVPVDIDGLLAPGGGGEPALCCASCSSSGDCTGCVNLPTFSNCFGDILACPDGEILTDDGGGSCA